MTMEHGGLNAGNDEGPEECREDTAALDRWNNEGGRTELGNEEREFWEEYERYISRSRGDDEEDKESEAEDQKDEPPGDDRKAA